MKYNINLNNFARTYKTSSKVNLKIPFNLNEIIIGNLLGDGHISKRNTYSNSRFEFTQSIKNRIYIDHLYSLFKDHCGAKPRIRTITLKSEPGKEYQTIGFKTLCLPCFNIYW
jgi:LAGLIDADG DNA endonuclease family